VVPQHRSFRRFIRKMVASFLKRQYYECKNGFQMVMEKLQDIEDSIEIIAREMARQAKRGE
jgi:hypothetical protein